MVSGGTQISNLLFNNISNITLTCSTAFSIQYNNTVRGKLSSGNIMFLTADLNTNNSVSKNFQGFPLILATSITNTITLNCDLL